MSRRTSSITAARVGSPVLASKTWFLKRSHSARRRKYSASCGLASFMRTWSPLAHLLEYGLDLDEQVLEGERLADVVDRPFLQPLDAVLGLGPGGQHRHRDVRRLLVHPEQLQDLPPVHLRHHDVEQDQVRLLELGLGEGLVAAGGGGDVVSLLPEHQ